MIPNGKYFTNGIFQFRLLKVGNVRVHKKKMFIELFYITTTINIIKLRKMN